MTEPIYVNERPVDDAPGCTVAALRARYKSDADVVILNGFPVRDADTQTLSAGDRLTLIRRGERPSPEELAATMTARNNPGVAMRLARATVGIAGLGGLGSNLAAALARIGLGRLILADFDVVEPSNLNRQLFFADQIGESKAEATAANLRRITPNVALTVHAVRLTPANIPTLFADADVVAECFDLADQKRMLIQTVLTELRAPVVAVSGIAGYGDSNKLVVRRRHPRLWIIGDGTTAAGPGMGLMAPRVLQAVGMQANTIVRILMEETEP